VPDLNTRGAAFAEFWRERHLCTLTTVRPDGTPHVVPVGVTLDLDALDAGTGPPIARVICRGGSVKARNAATRGTAVVSQVDGRRWSTLEGEAVVRSDADAVADAERRYALRYRTPRPNPERVVIEITVFRVLGMA
jgi:PPOX class probable F420-dependent enzyme